MSAAGTLSESVALVETTLAEKIGSMETTTDVPLPESRVARFERAMAAVVGNAGKPAGIVLDTVSSTVVPAATDAPRSERLPETGPPAIAMDAVVPLVATGTVVCTENAAAGLGLALAAAIGRGVELVLLDPHATIATAEESQRHTSRNR